MKVHSFLATLCLAAPLCLAEPADVDADYEEDYGEDYEEPSERTYTAEEKAAAEQKFAELLRGMNTALQGVKDKATADAAAPIYAEHEEHLMEDEVLRALSGVDIPADVYELLRQRSELQAALKETFYYGSAALAEAVSGDAEDALTPQPLTPEIQAALLEDENEDNVRVDFESSSDGEESTTLSGGPGFTRETAWVSSATNSASARFSQMLLLDKYSNISSSAGMKQVIEADKVYYVYTLDFVVDGVKYRGDVWVDVSSGIKIYTPEQQQAALEHAIAVVREAADILKGIHDKATADAAAERLPELRQSLYEETREILNSMDPKTVIEAIKAAAPSDEELKAHQKRLKDNDFYGSEKLKSL